MQFALAYIVAYLAPLLTWLFPNGDYRTPSRSASDVLRACFDTDELGERPKEMYLNGRVIKEPSIEARDAKNRAMVWKDSVAYVQLKKGDTVLADWR
jgi:hypothetical protein